MSTYAKIELMYVGKLNNAEYTYYMDRMVKLILLATIEKLHISEALLKAIQANIELMTDIVTQSYVSNETAEIATVDKEADELIVYLLGTFRTGKGSPVADIKSAATTLYNATHTYVGCQKLPQKQQVQEMRGLLTDLKKTELAALVTTLGLTSTVTAIAEVTERYAALLDSRAASQVAAKLNAGKKVRAEMDDQYEDILAFAQGASLLDPTAESAAFVTAMNKLTADTEAAYNQRRAQEKL